MGKQNAGNLMIAIQMCILRRNRNTADDTCNMKMCQKFVRFLFFVVRIGSIHNEYAIAFSTGMDRIMKCITTFATILRIILIR